MKQLLPLIIIVVLLGCKRREMSEESYVLTALIPINIDWSEAKLDPDNDPQDDVYSASAWFYSQDDDSQDVIIKRLTNPSGDTIELPVGTYSVLIFNNTINDFANIEFRGTDSFDSFEAYSSSDTQSIFYSKADGTSTSVKPDILATWSITDFEVSQEMVTVSRNGGYSAMATRSTEENLAKLSDVKPQLVVDTASVTVHVQGLNNASSATGVHTGLSSSVYMASGTTSDNQTSHTFTLSNRTYYDDSSSDGTVSASYRSFGRHSQTDTLSHSLQIDFTLNDSSSHPTQEFDVSDQVNSSSSRLQLSTTVGLEDSDSDHTIVLPDVSIDGDGFNIGLDDWDTEVDVPLEI